MNQYNEPREEQFTRWHNPLPVEQYVDLFMGAERRPTRFRWKPGETRELPNRFDNAIHTVHNGVIIGGLAPQLVKVGAKEVLDTALDTEAVKKRQAETEQAAAMLARRAADEALIKAAAMKQEAESAAKAKEAEVQRAESSPAPTPSPQPALPPDLKADAAPPEARPARQRGAAQGG